MQLFALYAAFIHALILVLWMLVHACLHALTHMPYAGIYIKDSSIYAIIHPSDMYMYISAW
jgi:hypothetical protein